MGGFGVLPASQVINWFGATLIGSLIGYFLIGLSGRLAAAALSHARG